MQLFLGIISLNIPTTFNILKDHISSLIGPKPTFGVHDPLELRHLFQLRVNLNPLRSHKSHH